MSELFASLKPICLARFIVPTTHSQVGNESEEALSVYHRKRGNRATQVQVLIGESSDSECT